jgi:three-Cys-motif partner protein
MADVFEERKDLDAWRARLWPLIEETPFLDWLLLTKRPENIRRLVPWNELWPKNVWLGTTVENQRYASRRIPLIAALPAAVRFISCEPLLGPLKLSDWLSPAGETSGINWVIAGGESGHHSRPMNPTWLEDLRDECVSSDVPFHFKQWGHWGPESAADIRAVKSVDLQGREGSVRLFRVGKKKSGRLLAGRTWDQVPAIT